MKKNPIEKQKGQCWKCGQFKPIAVVMHGKPLCERCYEMTQLNQKRSKR